MGEQDLGPVILRHNGDKATISNIYDYLILNGAGQWTNGFHVAIASLGYPETLEVLLKAFDGESFNYQGYNDKNAVVKLVFDLCLYFDKK